MVAVKVSVLRGKEGVDDPLWDRLDRHKNAPLGSEFGQQATITRVNTGHDRRLIMCELLVIGQLAVEAPNCDADEPASGDQKQDRADEQEPEEREYCATL